MENKIKEGDLITAYHAGYHRVTKIERRFYTEGYKQRFQDAVVGEEYSPLIHYRTVANAKFKKVNSKKDKYCDASYCKIVDIGELLDDEKFNHAKRIEGIKSLDVREELWREEEQEIIDGYNRGETIEYRNKGIGNSEWTPLPRKKCFAANTESLDYFDWEIFEYRLR